MLYYAAELLSGTILLVSYCKQGLLVQLAGGFSA